MPTQGFIYLHREVVLMLTVLQHGNFKWKNKCYFKKCLLITLQQSMHYEYSRLKCHLIEHGIIHDAILRKPRIMILKCYNKVL